MGPKHRREDMLEAAAQVVAEEGLAGLTYRRVAERLAIPDRTVVYYFPHKGDLLRAVLEGHADRLKALLVDALGSDRLPPAVLLGRTWSALRSDDADAAFRVFFEVVGHAAAGRSPQRELSSAMADEWVDWLADRVAASPDQRLRHAAALVAQLDGLLLLRHIGRPELADAAASALLADEPRADRAARPGPVGEGAQGGRPPGPRSSA